MGRVGRDWNRVSRAVLESPSLEVSQSLWMWNLGTWLVVNTVGSGLDLGISKVFSNLYDSHSDRTRGVVLNWKGVGGEKIL